MFLSRRRRQRTGQPDSCRLGRHSANSGQRRLFLEHLEDRSLLATLAVATNATIFDTASAAPHAEATNLVSELTALSHTATPFTDLSAAGIASALAGTDAVAIPEQEFGSLNSALTVAAKDVLAQYVSSGHGMIVIGSPSGRAESLLNGLFGFSIAAGPDPAGASFLDDVDSVGTAFATGPFAVFNFVTKVTAFDISVFPTGFPAGTKLLYKFGSVRTAGLFPYGQGQIVYLGYDFDDPAGQPLSANWKVVLGLAVDQVAIAPPTTTVELVGGDLVISDTAGVNDAFSLTANSSQWTIEMESGRFAAASIPGVTVSDQSIVIDKALATTFTGQFTFAGGDGNDLLSVRTDDLSRDVHFDGGESAGDHDLLKLSSIAVVASTTSSADSQGGGTIDLGSDGDVEITYAGLEPVDLTGVAATDLHFAIPAGTTAAELIDYLAPTDGYSQLRFNGAGPEDQFFRHPSSLLAIHTSGSSLVALSPLDPTAPIPELLLDGATSDLFRMDATSGIGSETSLTLEEATLDLNGQSPVIDGLGGDGEIVNAAVTSAVLTVGGTIEPGSPGSQPGLMRGSSEIWQAGSRLAVQLGGATPGSGHDQRRISGSLSIQDAVLDASFVNSFVPSQQPPTELTIVDNQGGLPVDGTFLGFPEGASVNLPGSPVPLFITYQGGDGNDIVLFALAGSQILGTGGDDTLILRRQGAGAADSELEYSLNSAPFVPLSAVDSLAIDMGGGNDLVTLDFVFGEPVPPGGLEVDGGSHPGGAPGDRLVLLGSNDGTEAFYRPGNITGEQGSIELLGAGNGVIELAGLEAIDATALAEVTLATQAAGSDIDVVDAVDALTGTHAALRISGASGPATIVPLHVWSVDSLVIDTTAAAGADSLLVVSAAGAHGIGDFQIDTGTQSADRTVVGATAVAGDFVIRSGAIQIGGTVTAGGSIDVTSRGLLRIDAPVSAQGPVTLATTDQAGLDADLAMEAAVSSADAGLVLHSADNAIIRSPLSAATGIDITIDTVNTDPGEGDTLFLHAPLVAPGGTTATGNTDADRFEIEPQAQSTLLILGGLPAGAQTNPQSGNATSGDVAGDKLVLDMTTTGDGQFVVGPVVIDSVGGRATAENTCPITYRSIEDLDLYDGETLTTAQQGDIYVRGTNLGERIYVAYDTEASPRLRISIQGRMFPENQGYFGPYVRGRTVLIYGRGGNDFLELSSTPLRGEFHGETGNDYLAGAEFGDLLIGGAGRDTLLGGSQGGGDELWGDDFAPIPKDDDGQPIANPTAAQLMENREYWSRLFSPTDGPDTLQAAGGDDQLYGQGGDDQLHPGAGSDYASGGAGNDRLTGGDGDDRLFGNDGDDRLSGDGGNDLLSGGSGDDLLSGRLGNDVLIGGDGADELRGHEGNDLLLAGIVTRQSAIAGSPAASADSIVAGDAADQAMLALLVEWSALGQATGVTQQDDGDLDWLYGHTGSDRFVGDGTSQNYDFVVGVDAAGL